MKHFLVKYEPGTIILNEGNQNDGLLLINDGQAEIFKKGNYGQKIPLALVGRGTFLGDMSLFSHKPISASVIAITKVEVLKISLNEINEELKQSPIWLVSLAKGALERVRILNTILKENGVVDEKLTWAITALECENISKDA